MKNVKACPDLFSRGESSLLVWSASCHSVLYSRGLSSQTLCFVISYMHDQLGIGYFRRVIFFIFFYFFYFLSYYSCYLMWLLPVPSVLNFRFQPFLSLLVKSPSHSDEPVYKDTLSFLIVFAPWRGSCNHRLALGAL